MKSKNTKDISNFKKYKIIEKNLMKKRKINTPLVTTIYITVIFMLFYIIIIALLLREPPEPPRPPEPSRQ